MPTPSSSPFISYVTFLVITQRFAGGGSKCIVNKEYFSVGGLWLLLVNYVLKVYFIFRNSKLTQLLQDSIGGNAKTLMFVNISPAYYNIDETMTSLM